MADSTTLASNGVNAVGDNGGDQGKGLCWALHDFDAENEDELSFHAGEKIVITQRDELYGDGWYEGRNTKGEIGLFPQSYTSAEPPTPEEDDDDGNGEARATTGTPEPAMAANVSEVQQALDKLQGTRQPGTLIPATLDDDDSLSMVSADQASQLNGSDDERAERGTGVDDGLSPSKSATMGTAHRAALAAKAAENAEKAAREERERAERRRREDEEAYEKARSDGFVPDLQLSSESEGEEEMPPLPVGMKSALDQARSAETQANGPSAVVESRAPDTSASAVTEGLGLSTTVIGGGVAGEDEARARADTLNSSYAESTYSTHSVDPSGATSAGVHPSSEDTAATDTLQTSQTSNGDSKDASPLGMLPEGLAAAGAGVAGLAAGAAAAMGLTSRSHAAEEPLRSVQETATSTSAAPVACPVVTAPTPVLPPAASPPIAETVVAPSTTGKSVPPPISTAGGTGPSPIPSPRSIAQSQTSSRLGPSAMPGSSDTSPRRKLPQDPAAWSVEDVTEWGKMKGFDALTLSKFQEHEISGDVLLEMDVAMLKEIDLVAFGRRVHIYNAIKELRQRSHTRPMSMVSPSMSGYEPDSPGNMSFASPGAMSFASPSMPYPQSNSGGSHNDDLHGLGLDDQDSSRPASSLARSANGGLTPQRSKSMLGAGSQNVPTGATLAATGVAAAAAGVGATAYHSSHNRTSTGGDSAHVPQESVVETVIPEEDDDETETAHPSIKSPVLGSAEDKSARKNSVKLPVSKGNRSDSSNPSSPNPNSTKRKESLTSDRSFFGVPVGRSRKPPPRVPSALLMDSDGRVARPNAANRNSRLLQQSKRSTRLFGSFGGSGSEKGIEGNRRSSGSTLGSGREAPSSMSPRTVDQATREMMVEETEAVQAGENLLEKIGTPDYSGWMQKKGEKYNTWKQRFFVLKGVHLYYLKSESEQRVKGFINLRGYRVISDPNIHPGFFGFKLVHDSARDHYFSAAEQVTIRSWMKQIMKSTIDRDYSEAALSSCDIETMPLAVAQAMTPRPRPPSPTERARVQRERYAGTNPNTLSQKDAQLLMDAQALMEASPPSSPVPNSGAGAGTAPGFMRRSSSNMTDALAGKKSPKSNSSIMPPPVVFPARTEKSVGRSVSTGRGDPELLEWVTSHMPPSTSKPVNLNDSLRSGEVIVRLVEKLSGKDSGISDDDFAKFSAPTQQGQLFNADYFDTIFNVFDFLSANVSTEDVSMDDMLSGNEPQLTLLLRRIRTKFA